MGFRVPKQKPRGQTAHGAIKITVVANYFFAAKICFDIRDFWREATFLWMTSPLTALSKAELKAMAAARVFSASPAVTAFWTLLARVFRRVLIFWLRAAFRRDLRAALSADLVLAMAVSKLGRVKDPKSGG